MGDAVVIIGIDEAGYGPILGPLVVSAVAFEVPRVDADGCLWTLLSGSVSSTASRRDSRISVVDSKKLHHASAGVGRLERSVLATVSARGASPATMRALLKAGCPEALPLLAQYPWYASADPLLPVAADAGAVRIATRRLRANLRDRSMRFGGWWSEVLPEGHYNRLVGATDNKAVVLLGQTLRLVQRVADAFPGRELRFFVDKQGAREHYGPALLRSFEDRRLRILAEDDAHSAYELVGRSTSWEVRFSEGGEARHMPVALASCYSKYLRELLMAAFNEYWRRAVPGLRPTAGYYQDGQRFLRDLSPHLDRIGVARDSLVRVR